MRKVFGVLVLCVVVWVVGAHVSAASSRGGLPGPGSFVGRVDNPWFPLRPGSVYVYRGVSDGCAPSMFFE